MWAPAPSEGECAELTGLADLQRRTHLPWEPLLLLLSRSSSEPTQQRVLTPRWIQRSVTDSSALTAASCVQCSGIVSTFHACWMK